MMISDTLVAYNVVSLQSVLSTEINREANAMTTVKKFVSIESPRDGRFYKNESVKLINPYWMQC